MKIIFLLSLIYTFMLANQTQIILGTFSTQSSASKVQKNVSQLIKKDKKFQNFIDKNSLKTSTKKHGKYFIVTIEPFSDIVTSHSVLNRIKKTKYKDAYIFKIISPQKPNEEKKEKEKTFVIPEPEIIDDPLLMPEPDINSIEIAPLTHKSDADFIKKEKKDIIIKEKNIVIKENIIKRPTKELDVLETYFNEIIAAIAILILIVVYFMIKKSKHKENNDFESFTSRLDTQEDNTEEESVVEKVQEPELMVMQERNETINFDSLIEEDEKEKEEEKITAKPHRIKRGMPPSSKITKENFKEFAGQKILVAEDNIINQKVIKGLLADSGIEVTIADDGQFLLEILEKNSDFNFILMDAHMPRIDGFEATRRIRKNPDYDHIIIIALSGDTAPDDIRKMIESGMEEHLEKPLRIDAMYNILYAYTDSTQKIPDELVEIVITKELDTDAGLNICGDDIEFYHEILDEFANTYSQSPKILKEFIKHNEITKASLYLFDLSGIAANIGAIHISVITANLQEALVNSEDKKYIELMIEYEKLLHILLEEIKKYKEID